MRIFGHTAFIKQTLLDKNYVAENLQKECLCYFIKPKSTVLFLSATIHLLTRSDSKSIGGFSSGGGGGGVGSLGGGGGGVGSLGGSGTGSGAFGSGDSSFFFPLAGLPFGLAAGFAGGAAGCFFGGDGSFLGFGLPGI